MGQPTFDTWKIIPVGMILFALTDERAFGPILRGGGQYRRVNPPWPTRSRACGAFAPYSFSMANLRGKRVRSAQSLARPTGRRRIYLGQIAYPKSLATFWASDRLRRARAGQAIFDGRYGRERNKTVEVVCEDNRNGFQVSIKGILT